MSALRLARLGQVAAALAVLGGAPVGCSLTLDFEDECKVEADCAVVGRGMRCDRGFCTKKDLLQVDGPCDRVFGEDPRTAAEGSVIVIGTLLPKSGALGSYGQPMENGVELAVSEINQSGGVLGRKIGVVACDSGTDAAQGVLGARHLVDVAEVDAIVGAGASGVTIEAFTKVAKPGGVLMVTPSATSPAITNLPDDGLLWRTAPSDAIQGRAIAGHLLESGARRVAVVNRDDAYGNGLALVVQQELCAATTCTSDNFINRVYAQDFADPVREGQQVAIVADLEAFAPDTVVLVAFVEDGVRLLNLAEGKGFRWVLTDGMKDAGLLGPRVSGAAPGTGVASDATLCAIVGTNPGAPDPTFFQPFEVKYSGRYGTPPKNFEARSYDALYAIGLAYAAAHGAGVADADVDGRALALGLTRLASGLPIAFGIEEWNSGVAALSADATTSIDISGASGRLDFNPVVGEAPGAIDLWRFDLDAASDDAKIEELGVVLDDTGRYIQGVVTARPTGDPCRSGR